MKASRTQSLCRTPFCNNKFPPGCYKYRRGHTRAAELRVPEAKLPEYSTDHYRNYPSSHRTARCNLEYSITEVNLIFFPMPVPLTDTVERQENSEGQNKYFPAWCRNP